MSQLDRIVYDRQVQVLRNQMTIMNALEQMLSLHQPYGSKLRNRLKDRVLQTESKLAERDERL